MRGPESRTRSSAAVRQIPGDQYYALAPRKAETKYSAFIELNRESRDKSVQDDVAKARIKLAYLAARSKSYRKSRSILNEAVAQYRGKGEAAGDYGGLKDQAAYQASVTFVGEGDLVGAAKAFRSFIRSYPLSPLVFSAYRRLQRLGVATSADEAALQAAIATQERQTRMEMAMCGPKSLTKMLGLLGVNREAIPSYQEMAKLSGTTERGTSIEGLRKGLRSLGFNSYAFELNRKDLAAAPMPAVLFTDNHFLVLEAVEADRAKVYDSLFGRERYIELPPLENKAFSAFVITLTVPSVGR